MIDLLGSGFSDKPDNHLYTVKEHANYLYNFVQDLKLYKFIIFGEKSLSDDDQIELEIHMINIEIIKSAGHSMAWENPKRLAEAIRKGILYARGL